ncbi:hypothetical protein POSPLADRAFT_1131390 [Postia placenta MAD-698-R-SB12]|uniref:Cytochrome P450 n=1 Tax=Postia placenta MAD-698-R-SB12 TaxID=670580 RepID=A0A1X6NBG1_9APHY|nr:hypothetical protein POSPLADRAFT_1131390 [Postia placenta MAD-698-R-SB12]OSX65860.1 hypothetical protein POSPLADRAFT_1131390 [Postia placenta MAD-698-R-SB12]
MSTLSSAALLLTLACIYVAIRRLRRTSVSGIPGPQPESFLMGNLGELHQGQAGEADFKWQSVYGGIARIKAPFGEDMLWISDPKALQYIFQTSGYNFPKQPERRALSRLLGDHGLTWADGTTHKRQRKVMLPAFGGPESRALLPIFEHYAEQVTLRWKEMLETAPGRSAVLNVIKYIAPATLDAIGEAAFDYKLGCLENSEDELAKAYQNLLADVFTRPSKAKIFFTSIAHYIPMPLAEFMYDHLPGQGLEKARFNRDVAHSVAEGLLKSKSHDLMLGKGNRDVMSILVKANASENDRARLTHDEMISQMRTIMLAGQETTSNTLSFALMELARYPQYQTRLRAEIRAAEQTVRERGDVSLSVQDMEAMPFLQAVVREVLRFHPVVPHNYRQAGQDDVLPLSKPLTLRSGEVVTEVAIPAGMRLVLSIAGYNRDKDIWGSDAHVFNPERFLEHSGKRGPTVGVFGNVLTFSGGIRACIGWRFALYELQAFIVQLISNFEFALTDDIKRLRRENALVMVPTLEGEAEKGVQVPLRVSLAGDLDY